MVFVIIIKRMKPQIQLIGIPISTYGLCIAIGLVIANILAVIEIKKKKKDINDLFIIEGYCLLGGFIGAKLLYMCVIREYINFKRLITDEYYLCSIMNGGFVFYGGLIGAIIFLIIPQFIHRINIEEYINDLCFLVPLVHCFGRIGCFMAGCCYGIPYEGRFSVVFPDGAMAPAGMKLFPVQLLEAILLFIISLLLYIISKKKKRYTIGLYFLTYGLVRLGVEYLRYDTLERGGLLYSLSISQWISIAFILIGVTVIYSNRFIRNYNT